MKYAITGHTAGLGKAIAHHVGVANTLGFSRSNGYDITNAQDRQRIVEAAQDCDVFINNAHADYNQTQLLYDLWQVWSEQDKIIVNIGSNTTDGIKYHPHEYSAQKASLEKANEQLANLNKPCRVTMFRFGYIGTERILNDYNPTSFIQLADAARCIIYALNLTHHYRLTSMSILPK
jgi:hypothetical protein